MPANGPGRAGDDDSANPGAGEGEGGLLAWLLRQERLLFDRLERFRREEDALRAYEATRAGLCWDEDRRREAEELGEKLGRKPASVRARLGGSRHGALWLIERWNGLAGALDRAGEWTDAQTTLAIHLLGVPTELRVGAPWEFAGLGTARALVQREVNTLTAHLARHLDTLDALERQQAAEGRPVTPSPELLRLRREESACWRRLRAIQKDIAVLSDELAKAEPDEESEEVDAPTTPTPARLSPETYEATRVALPAASTTLVPPLRAGNRRARRAALRHQRQAIR